MTYNIQTTELFKKHLLKLRDNQPKLYDKVFRFIDELRTHPRTGTGHPEQLKHYDTETWSRQINKQHRLVYEINENVVTVVLLSAFGHYEDK